VGVSNFAKPCECLCILTLAIEVFANAGVVEKVKFYEEHKGDSERLPPHLDSAVVDVNLKSVITTSYLALHFFRQNKLPGGSLVITASTGGVYPTPYLPMYAATKHGCVGFTRSIAENLAGSGIRVNSICPGSVATGLLKKEDWSKFPQDTFMPVDTVAEAVYMLVEDENLNGQSVELVEDRLHLRTPPEPLDPALKKMMSKTVAFSR
jgi:NAD(P)-dependent dehydrogenase (short-subunit alcohol dehydrogenase family)